MRRHARCYARARSWAEQPRPKARVERPVAEKDDTGRHCDEHARDVTAIRRETARAKWRRGPRRRGPAPRNPVELAELLRHARPNASDAELARMIGCEVAEIEPRARAA